MLAAGSGGSGGGGSSSGCWQGEIDQAARPSLTKRGKSNDCKRKQVQREAPQLLIARPDSARPALSVLSAASSLLRRLFRLLFRELTSTGGGGD